MVAATFVPRVQRPGHHGRRHSSRAPSVSAAPAGGGFGAPAAGRRVRLMVLEDSLFDGTQNRVFHAADVAVRAAALGADASLVARVAQDDAGAARAKRWLSERGVRSHLLQQGRLPPSARETGLASLAVEPTRLLLSAISDADALVFSDPWSRAARAAAAAATRPVFTATDAVNAALSGGSETSASPPLGDGLAVVADAARGAWLLVVDAPCAEHLAAHLGLGEELSGPSEGALIRACSALSSSLGCGVVITRLDDRGALLRLRSAAGGRTWECGGASNGSAYVAALVVGLLSPLAKLGGDGFLGGDEVEWALAAAAAAAAEATAADAAPLDADALERLAASWPPAWRVA